MWFRAQLLHPWLLCHFRFVQRRAARSCLRSSACRCAFVQVQTEFLHALMSSQHCLAATLCLLCLPCKFVVLSCCCIAHAGVIDGMTHNSNEVLCFSSLTVVLKLCETSSCCLQWLKYPAQHAKERLSKSRRKHPAEASGLRDSANLSSNALQKARVLLNYTSHDNLPGC